MERALAHRATLHKGTNTQGLSAIPPGGANPNTSHRLSAVEIEVYAQPWRLHPTCPCRTAAHLDPAAWRHAERALALPRAVHDQKPYHLKMVKWRRLHLGGEPLAPQQQAEQWGEPGRDRHEKNVSGNAETLCRLLLIKMPKRHLLFRDKVRLRSTPTRSSPVGDPGRRDSTRTSSSTSFAENSMRRCS